MAHVYRRFKDKKYDATLVVEAWTDGKVTFSVEGKDAEFGVILGRKSVAKMYDFIAAAMLNNPRPTDGE